MERYKYHISWNIFSVSTSEYIERYQKSYFPKLISIFGIEGFLANWAPDSRAPDSWEYDDDDCGWLEVWCVWQTEGLKGVPIYSSQPRCQDLKLKEMPWWSSQHISCGWVNGISDTSRSAHWEGWECILLQLLHCFCPVHIPLNCLDWQREKDQIFTDGFRNFSCLLTTAAAATHICYYLWLKLFFFLQRMYHLLKATSYNIL